MMTGTESDQKTTPPQDFKPLLDAKRVKTLAQHIGSELDMLAPPNDKAAFQIVFIGATIRDFLRQQGQRPHVTLFQNGVVYVTRSSNLTLEIVSGLDAFYCVWAAAEAAEKTIVAHWLAMRKEVTPEYRYSMLCFITHPLGAVVPVKQVHGADLLSVGDFVVGDGPMDTPTHRLYMVAVNVDLRSHKFVPVEAGGTDGLN